MEKRTDFRLDISNKRCLLSNLIVPEADIVNISGTGMSILVAEDRLDGVFEIQFSVHGRSFTRKAAIEWRKTTTDGQWILGLSFLDQTESERVYLHSVLMTEAAIMYQMKKAVGAL